MTTDEVCEGQGDAAKNAVAAAKDASEVVDKAGQAFNEALATSQGAAWGVELACGVALPATGFGGPGAIAGGAAFCAAAILAWEPTVEALAQRAEELKDSREALADALENAKDALKDFEHCLQDARGELDGLEEEEGIEIFDEDEEEEEIEIFDEEREE
jgi:hypothetical protein